jgi:predicted porin
MKKTLVALAALAATASFAQSTVTISGTLDPSVAMSTTTYGDGASVSKSFVRNSSQGTSQITFTGTEDLGGGMKAAFRYEGDFTTAEGASATNSIGGGGGDIWAGLEGGFGALKIGTPNNPSLSVQASRNFIGTKLGSGFGGVSGVGRVRDNNSVRYDTPSFSGFSAAISYAFGSPAVAVANGGTNVETAAKSDVGLFYSNGPINAGLSFYSQDNVTKQTNFAGSYDFGMAKVYLGYNTEDNTKGVTAKGYNVAADFNISPTMVAYGNFGVLTDDTAAGLNKRISALGVKYSMSKRTSVYSRYVAETNDNITAAASVRSVNTFLVGVQHNF